MLLLKWLLLWLVDVELAPVEGTASNRLERVRRWRGEADAEREGGRELMSGDMVWVGQTIKLSQYPKAEDEINVEYLRMRYAYDDGVG